MAVLFCATDFAPAVDVGLTFCIACVGPALPAEQLPAPTLRSSPLTQASGLSRQAVHENLSAEPQLVPDKLHSPIMSRLLLITDAPSTTPAVVDW